MSDSSSILTTILLFTVILCIIIRPKNINVAWPAGIGAVVAIIFGLISLESVKTVFLDTWDACFTLIALFILSEALESNKFFDWAALHLAIKSKGSGWKLYFYILILTTAATALLANDGAILMLTPIFATLLKKIYPKNSKAWLPYIFAAGFFADSMSALFIPSNLTNIIIAGAYKLNFLDTVIHLFMPTLAAFVVGALAFGLRFKKRLEVPYIAANIPKPHDEIKDFFVFWMGWAGLVSLIIGYVIGGSFHLPVTFVALPIALIMLLVVHIRKLRSAKDIILNAPWSILIYAIGMFIVITAAYKMNILNIIMNPLRYYAQRSSSFELVFFPGTILAVLSAIFNNLPASLIGVLGLKEITDLNPTVLHATLLGVNIGPKLTPFGSLSTLLWLSILKKNKINISWKEYIQENWWITVLVLLSSLLALAFV